MSGLRSAHKTLAVVGIAVVLGSAGHPEAGMAQTAISVDGRVASTAGGLRFPDGTLQGFAVSAAGPAPVEDTGQRFCCQRPSCTGTGLDGELQSGVDWPAPRFRVNGDGTVTDLLTGLVWLQNADCFGGLTWDDALQEANALGSGDCGLTDGSSPGEWRLPNIQEMLSLLDFGEYDPALPPAHPFSFVEIDFDYYTSTSYSADPASAWTVSLDNGSHSDQSKTGGFSIWPVRDPGGSQ